MIHVSRVRIVSGVAIIAIVSLTVAMLVHRRKDTATTEYWHSYPDTGFGSFDIAKQGNKSVVQPVTHLPTGQPALFDLAYEDTVHPDEDLLMPDGAPASPSVAPSVPNSDNSYPNTNHPKSLPTPGPIKPPAQQQPIEQPTLPDVQTPQPSPAPRKLELPSSPKVLTQPSVSGERFDPNRGPAADEDLLQPATPKENQQALPQAESIVTPQPSFSQRKQNGR